MTALDELLTTAAPTAVASGGPGSLMIGQLVGCLFCGSNHSCTTIDELCEVTLIESGPLTLVVVDRMFFNVFEYLAPRVVVGKSSTV